MAAILCPAVPQGRSTLSKKKEIRKKKKKRVLALKLFECGTVQFAVNRAGYCKGSWEPHRPECWQLRHGGSHFIHCHSSAMKNSYMCTGRAARLHSQCCSSEGCSKPPFGHQVFGSHQSHTSNGAYENLKRLWKVKEKMFGSWTPALPSTGPWRYYSTTKH